MATAEDRYATVRTSVWWDIENCQVAKSWDAYGIAQNISSALMKLNYSGPISISAYGDTNRIPFSVQRALSSTGVALNHVPAGGKDASDKKILVDMLLWAVDNPAPANLMLISGDRDFSNALHQLRMRRYNVLLAHPQAVAAPLITAATNLWLWTSLALGGSPLTCCESSRLASSRHFRSDSEATNDSSINLLGLHSEHKENQDKEQKFYLKTSSQEIKREKIQSCGSQSDSVWFCKMCNIACKSFETFTSHLYDKRHIDQAEHVAHCGSIKPSKITNNTEEGLEHQKRFERMSGKLEDTVQGHCKSPDDDVEDKDWMMIKGVLEAKAIKVCGLCSVLCQGQDVYESHITGRKHAARLKKQAEECFDVKNTQEEIGREDDRSKEVIKELKLCPGEVQGTKLSCTNGSIKAGIAASEYPMDKVEKKKKKLIERGIDADSIKACGLCQAVYLDEITFESHINGVKHVQRSTKKQKALSDAKESKEGIVQQEQKHEPSEVIKELQFQSQEAPENVKSKEERDEEQAGRGSVINIEKSPIHPKEARECIVTNSEKLELSKGVEVFEKLNEVPEQSSEPKSRKDETLSEREIEHEEMQTEVNERDPKADAIRVCFLCSVASPSHDVFESHLRGQMHAANVKKQAEAVFDTNKAEEERDDLKAMVEELMCLSEEAKEETIKCSDKQSEEKSELFEKLDDMFEQDSESKSGKDETVSEGAIEREKEKKTKKKKKKKRDMVEGGDESDAIRVCALCSVVCHSQCVFESHLKGRKHAAKVKKETGALLVSDAKKLQEETVRVNDQEIKATTMLQFQVERAPENINCLESLNGEMVMKLASSEKIIKEFCQSVVEDRNESPSNEDVRESSMDRSAMVECLEEKEAEKEKKKLTEEGAEANAMEDVFDTCQPIEAIDGFGFLSEEGGAIDYCTVFYEYSNDEAGEKLGFVYEEAGTRDYRSVYYKYSGDEIGSGDGIE